MVEGGSVGRVQYCIIIKPKENDKNDGKPLSTYIPSRPLVRFPLQSAGLNYEGVYQCCWVLSPGRLLLAAANKKPGSVKSVKSAPADMCGRASLALGLVASAADIKWGTGSTPPFEERPQCPTSIGPQQV